MHISWEQWLRTTRRIAERAGFLWALPHVNELYCCYERRETPQEVVDRYRPRTGYYVT